MNLFSAEQMLMFKASLTIRQMILIQIKAYITQLLIPMNNKRCLLGLNWERISDIKILYINTAV